MDVIAAHLRQCAILPFPFLDDWFIRDLLHCRLISHTIYCRQTVERVGFQNFVEDEEGLEEGNNLTLLLLLEKSLLVLDIEVCD